MRKKEGELSPPRNRSQLAFR